MREEIIRACFPKENLSFRAVRDYPYNDHVWTTEIQNVVNEIVEEDGDTNAKIAICGFFKDRSSYYLKMFPQWNFEEYFRSDKKFLNISATRIRGLATTVLFSVWQKRTFLSSPR